MGFIVNAHDTHVCIMLIDSCIIQRKAQEPSRTCDESKEEVKEVSSVWRAGPNHTAGITAAGAVYTWGANDMRQLGYAGAEEGILGIDMDPRPVTATQVRTP